MYKPAIRIQTKRLPADVRKIIYDMQAEVKKECQCQFSQEQTIYKLIRMAVKSDDTNQTA